MTEMTETTKMREKMQKKIAIIAGASSGIGNIRYSFADFYAKKGYSLVLIARSKKKV